jgi:dienelactone hydrolase
MEYFSVGSRGRSARQRQAAPPAATIAIALYDGATHGFGDPSAKRQRVEANAAATEDAVEKAVRFFRQRLGRGI